MTWTKHSVRERGKEEKICEKQPKAPILTALVAIVGI